MNTVGLILLIISVLILILILFFLSLKIRLVIKFSKHQSEKVKSSFSVELFGGKIKKIFSFPKKKKADKKGHKKEETKKDAELSFSQKIKKYYGIFLRVKKTWSKSKRAVRKRILAEKIYLNLNFGTGDASHTGILTGTLWGAVYNVIAFLANFIRVTEPQISINPSYDEELLDFEGECILKMSMANIISIILVLSTNYYLVNRKQTKKEKAAINNVNTN